MRHRDLAVRWPHCFSSDTWFSIWMQHAPASMNCLASRYVASALPKPASMSAMIGTTCVTWLSIFSWIAAFAVASLAASSSRNRPPSHGRRPAQERVQLADQRADRGLFVHRLVRQRAELGAQRGDHPAGQVQVAAFGAVEVLLDGDHLLLADEAVPATQRLRVLGRVGVVRGHVGAHDLRGVLGDVQARLELVLGTHAGGVLRADRIPRAAVVFLQTGNCLDVVLILGHVNLLGAKRV